MKHLVIIAVLAIVVLVKASFYTVTEGKQVIITQFGKPVKAVTDAGLNFKKPFVHEIRYVDKRILSWDGYPNQIPTKDKKYISVDTTARWKIVDALKFIQTVQNERGAKARLDAILDASTRDVISNHKLVEAVRNSNQIIKMVEEKRKNRDATSMEEEISGEIEKVLVGREQLSQKIAKLADSELNAFGIELIDVQLRRISYEKSVEAKVYERMVSERQRIAQKIRSIGQGEKAKIEGRLNEDLKVIESGAYRDSRVLQGKADAKALAIYASTLRKDPKFYEFIRSMEAYEKSLKGKTKFLISTESEFFKFFK